MPRKRFDWLIIIALTAIIGIFWINATRVSAEEVNLSGRPPAAEINHTAPDFNLLTPAGDPISLSDYKGQPVILNFWATWCPPCISEIPALEAAWQTFGGEGVILGVDVQEPADQVLDFTQNFFDFPMTYPIALDSEAEVAKMYRVLGYPTTFFIDSRGVIVDIYTGPLNEPLLKLRLEQLKGD